MNNQPNNNEKKCDKCLVHYTGEHECDGLMKGLVEFNNEKKEEYHCDCPTISKCCDELNGLKNKYPLFSPSPKECDHMINSLTHKCPYYNDDCPIDCPKSVSSAEEIRKEWEKASKYPGDHEYKLGCCGGDYCDDPRQRNHNKDILDFFLSHRKAEYTSLIEEVEKKIGELENWCCDENHDPHVTCNWEERIKALSDIIKLIQERL
jgi:hypothetical protein